MVVLWARSYYSFDKFGAPLFDGYRFFTHSLDGDLEIGAYHRGHVPDDDSPWFAQSGYGRRHEFARDFYDTGIRRRHYAYGFGAMLIDKDSWVEWGEGTPYGVILYLPHWFIALCLATVAVAFKPKPRWRFSLLNLIFAMTSVGVFLGLFAILDRLPDP